MESIAGKSVFSGAFRYFAAAAMVAGTVSGCNSLAGWAYVLTPSGYSPPTPVPVSSDGLARRDARRKAERQKKIAELDARAEQGDTEAIIELAELTGDLASLEVLANNGNSTAAYSLYKQLSKDTKTSTYAWRWLCKAANEQYAQAQAKAGYWHQQNTWKYLDQQTRSELEVIGVRPDNQIAHMWFAVAATSGAADSQLANKGWGASVLTADEIAQAEQMVRDWKPGDCPSAEHRLGMPGET
jgi:hypothetical protein